MTTPWHPSASLNILKQRADLINKIRHFFAERDVLEVETPLLSPASNTDLHINSMQTHFTPAGEQATDHSLYLQTSPEFAMKRLLAAYAKPIYQISKAFRNGEVGRFHNPEFTMLEWYRPGFDHHQLMKEVDQLLQIILNTPPAEKCSYQTVFEKHLGINPHKATVSSLKQLAKKHHITINHMDDNKDNWLNLLLTHCIEPHIGQKKPSFIYDYPASQAALAKIRNDSPPVAERFEVYINGIELANGFHELTDAKEQLQRFQQDLTARKKLGYPPINYDKHLLKALEHGLPDCAGVALGLDRLIMLAIGAKHISEVIAFDFEY